MCLCFPGMHSTPPSCKTLYENQLKPKIAYYVYTNTSYPASSRWTTGLRSRFGRRATAARSFVQRSVVAWCSAEIQWRFQQKAANKMSIMLDTSVLRNWPGQCKRGKRFVQAFFLFFVLSYSRPDLTQITRFESKILQTQDFFQFF